VIRRQKKIKKFKIRNCEILDYINRINRILEESTLFGVFNKFIYKQTLSYSIITKDDRAFLCWFLESFENLESFKLSHKRSDFILVKGEFRKVNEFTKFFLFEELLSNKFRVAKTFSKICIFPSKSDFLLLEKIIRFIKI